MSENQELTFNLNINEVNIILQGLGEMPAKTSMNIIEKIRGQAAPQLSGPVPDEVVEEGA